MGLCQERCTPVVSHITECNFSVERKGERDAGGLMTIGLVGSWRERSS
jgi:hypothetical protein